MCSQGILVSPLIDLSILFPFSKLRHNPFSKCHFISVLCWSFFGFQNTRPSSIIKSFTQDWGSSSAARSTNVNVPASKSKSVIAYSKQSKASNVPWPKQTLTNFYVNSWAICDDARYGAIKHSTFEQLAAFWISCK